MDRPELDVEALRSALPRWHRVDVTAHTPSTNTELLARPNSPDRTLLATEFQSAGRGRLDRAWTSPPRAGITASFLLRPAAPFVQWGWLPLLAGVAVGEAVSETTGLGVRLKWPNDVLLDGAKLAGILTQSGAGSVVVGIGLNVSTTADELPEAVAATSLALAGAEVDRTALLIALADRLDARVAQWDDCGGDAEACGLASEYRQACDTIGREVVVTTGVNAGKFGKTGGSSTSAGDETITGTAVEVDEGGRLIVQSGGSQQIVAAGDVRHVRSSKM